jgi:peptidoglycan/LPS O-acetylase OafA/YrhL
MLMWALFVGLPFLIGYAMPARWLPWTLVVVAAVTAALWLFYAGAPHDDPWPFLVSPGAVGFVCGAAVRLFLRRIAREARRRTESR